MGRYLQSRVVHLMDVLFAFGLARFASNHILRFMVHDMAGRELVRETSKIASR